MAYTLHTDQDSVVQMLAAQAQAQLEAHLRAEIARYTDIIVSQAAKNMASGLVARIDSMRRMHEEKIEVMLRIDGTPVPFPKAPAP